MCAPMIMAAGQVIQGIAGYQQGRAAASAYESQAAANEYNAQRERVRAEDASERGRIEASDYMQEARQLRGMQKTAASSSGIDAQAGSSANVLVDSAIHASRDRDTILTNAQREKQSYEDQAINYKNQAASDRYSARSAKSAGRGALFKGLLGAASTAVGADWAKAKSDPVAYDMYTRKPIYAGDKRLRL